MSEKILKVFIAVCSLLLVCAFATGLCLSGSELLDGPSYIIDIASLLFFGGLVLFFSGKAAFSKNTTWRWLTAIAVLAWINIYPGLTGNWFLSTWHSLFISIWPVICLLLINKIYKTKYFAQKNVFLAPVIYNISVILLIYFSEELIFKFRYISADVIEEAYLFIVAQITFVLWNIKENKYIFTKKAIGIFSGAIVLIALIWMSIHPRIRDIFGSLRYSFSETDFNGEILNWLSHRIALVSAALHGNIEKFVFYPLEIYCHITWFFRSGLHYISVIMLILSISLITFMIILARKNRDNLLLQLLVISFAIKFVIGIFANLFFFTTSIGLPFIRTTYDVLPLLILLFRTKPHKMQQ